MSSRLIAVGTFLSLLLGACGSDDKGAPTSPSGGPSPVPSSATPARGDADAGSTPDANPNPNPNPNPSTTEAPKAAGPKITQIMKMMGGLHVVWELPNDCDGVELERKDGDAAYKVAYKLPGTVDNKHDGTATANLLYTYRARCKVGTEYTEYSNEMSKNPK